MKRKFLLSNKNSKKIENISIFLEINISNRNFFSNNSIRENNKMSIKIKGQTAIINEEVYDLSKPNVSDAIDFLEYARIRPEPIRLPRILENIVAMFPNPATFYAAEVLCRRWKKAEVEIIKNLEDIMQYVTFVEAPWPEVEDIIAKDAKASVEYAYLIRARFIKGEKAIVNSPKHLEGYREFLERDMYQQFKADHQL